MCLDSLWFTLSVSMVVSEWLRFLIVWLIMLWSCVPISYFIFIKICLKDICLLLSKCGLNCPNIANQCLLQSTSIQTILDWVVGFWVELFFSGSQLCLVYMLSWHSITPYVTNLLLICVYFHPLCFALVVNSFACLQMAPSPTKKKTPAKKTDKRLKIDHNLFRSVQHFERYKDSFLKGTIIQERFVHLGDLKDTFIPDCFEGR